LGQRIGPVNDGVSVVAATNAGQQVDDRQRLVDRIDRAPRFKERPFLIGILNQPARRSLWRQTWRQAPRQADRFGRQRGQPTRRRGALDPQLVCVVTRDRRRHRQSLKLIEQLLIRWISCRSAG